MTEAALMDLLPFALGLLAAGVVAGLMAGLFGVGGGAVLVPVFYQCFTLMNVDPAVIMHVSVATSLAIIIPTSIQSFLSHRKQGTPDTELLKLFVIFVPLGTLIGVTIAAFVNADVLKAVFAVIALLIALKMLFGKASWRLGDDLPQKPGRAVAGTGIGILSTLMGIGGGSLNNAFMTLYNRPIHQAVGTSAGCGVLISIPAAIGFVWTGLDVENLPPLSVGYVNILAAGLLIPVTTLVAPLGVKLAMKMSKDFLSKAFGAFLILVAIRFFISLA